MVRKPVVAGMFYPAGKNELLESVTAMLDTAGDAALDPDVFAVIAPHAGISYSGPVAAAAYAQLKGMAVDTVVLLGPTHRVHLEKASPGLFESCETPLGALPVDTALGERLIAASDVFAWTPGAHLQEHSLEVQLPFLQAALAPGFSVLPIVCGQLIGTEIAAVAEALAETYQHGGRRLLFVCSTDLSHDFPYNDAVRMDRRIADLVQSLDYDTLAALFEAHDVEACGAVPLLCLMHLARLCGKNGVRIADMRNSGDIVGDTNSRIVGYMSAVIT